MPTVKQTPEQIRDEVIKASKKVYVAAVAAAKVEQEKTISEAWSKFLAAEKTV